jgi:hypothetical protein
MKKILSVFFVLGMITTAAAQTKPVDIKDNILKKDFFNHSRDIFQLYT